MARNVLPVISVQEFATSWWRFTASTAFELCQYLVFVVMQLLTLEWADISAWYLGFTNISVSAKTGRQYRPQ